MRCYEDHLMLRPEAVWQLQRTAASELFVFSANPLVTKEPTALQQLLGLQ